MGNLRLTMTRHEMVHDGVGRLWVALQRAGRDEEASMLYRLWQDDELIDLAASDDLFEPPAAPTPTHSTMIYDPMSNFSYVDAVVALEAATDAEWDEIQRAALQPLDDDDEKLPVYGYAYSGELDDEDWDLYEDAYSYTGELDDEDWDLYEDAYSYTGELDDDESGSNDIPF